jgi:hypothetical protein
MSNILFICSKTSGATPQPGSNLTLDYMNAKGK